MKFYLYPGINLDNRAVPPKPARSVDPGAAVSTKWQQYYIFCRPENHCLVHTFEYANRVTEGGAAAIVRRPVSTQECDLERVYQLLHQ